MFQKFEIVDWHVHHMREPEYDISQTDLEFMSKCKLQGVLTAILQSFYDLQAILQVPNLDNR